MTAPVFLSAEWRRLVMLNYPVDPKLLEPLVPRGTELDDRQGATYVSLVGFLFLNTKIKGVPVPFHRDFEEINLRFYVRCEAPEGTRRGVVFVREVVPRWAVASIARWIYNENYVACPIHSDTREPSNGTPGLIEFRWKHDGNWLRFGAEFSGQPGYPTKGSEEEFITEHYWGYASRRDGSSIEYRVEHPRWKVWPASRVITEGDFARFYGQKFGRVLASEPTSAFVADGSPVIVRSGSRVSAEQR